MPIDLPALPRLAQVTPRLLRFGADLTPSLGGPVQRVNRLGSRYAIDVSMPSLTGSCARAWLAARLKAEAENDTLRLTWPEGEGALAYGAAVVDGGGQAGTALAVRGLPANAPVPRGRFLSILYADGYRLHATTVDVVASSAGAAVLPIAPMLRKSPADGYSLHFNPVTVDVMAQGSSIDWELQLKRFSTFSVTLAEFH